MASKQIYLALLLAAVLCSSVMGKPCKKEDSPFLRQKPTTIGILRIRYFLFGDDSISQEELEIADLFKKEPTAGRDKVPPPLGSGGEQMRPTDDKGQPILKRPTDQPMAPNPSKPEGQPQIPNPAQDKNPVNPSMVDPSKADAPLPDESMNRLEQQKMKDPITNPNPMMNPAGQPSQMNQPNPENMDRKEQQPIQPNVLQQQSQPQQPQPQRQQFQPQQQLQQEFQPQQSQRQTSQPQQQPQSLQQQLEQSQPEFQPRQQPQQQTQPQQQLQQEIQRQQQPLANQRRKRSQSAQRVRQLLPDYDDSFPHYGPGTGDVHIYDDTHLYYDDPTRFQQQQRPRSNTDLRTDLRMQDDRSFYKPQRNDGAVDIELNI